MAAKYKTLAVLAAAALALSACSSGDDAAEQMPQDSLHQKIAQAQASPSASPSAEPDFEDLTTAQQAVMTGVVTATQLGFENSAKISDEDMKQLAKKPEDTLKDTVVLPKACSAPVEELNWSPAQLGSEAARTDFTNQNQTVTGSLEVAKAGGQLAQRVAQHYQVVDGILANCQDVKLQGLDAVENLSFSSPGVDGVDSQLYYSRDGQYAQNSLVFVHQEHGYVAMVSFISTSPLKDENLNKVAMSILNAALDQAGK